MEVLKIKLLHYKARLGYIVIFAILCFALIALAIYIYNLQRNKYHNESAQILMGISRLKSNHISQWISERRLDANIFINNPEYSNILKSIYKKEKIGRESTKWLTTVTISYNYKNIFIVDKNLDIYNPYGKKIFFEIDKELKNAIEVAYKTNKWSLISNISEKSNKLSLYSVIPIIDVKLDNVIGVILLQIDPNYFLIPYISNWPNEKQIGSNILESKDGKVLFASNNDYEIYNYDTQIQKLDIEFHNNEKTGLYIDKFKNRYICSYSPVVNSNWIVKSQQKLVDIDRPLAFLVIFLLSVLVMMIISTAIIIINLIGKQENEYLTVELEREKDINRIRQTISLLETQFQTTFEFAEIGLAHLKLNGDFTRVNQYLCDFIGWTRDELLHMNFKQITHPDDLENSNRLVNNLLNGIIPSFSTDKRYIKPDGSFIWAVVTVTILRSSEDVEPYFIVTITDISERKKLIEELERKNRELAQVIYVASHDLRSPLVNIQGFSKELEISLNTIKKRMLTDDFKNDSIKMLFEEIDESVNFIRLSSAHMDKLLTGLLRVSRTGRLPLNIVNIDMNNILSDALSNVEYLINDKNVEIILNKLPPCKGDTVLISQVFNNLILNAVKYLDKNRSGCVQISGYQTDFDAIYIVSDNGIGISQEYYEKIFELFHRLNPRDSDGDGLGLTIVRTILDRLNGRIWIDSKLGEGSNFYVGLPIINRYGDKND